MKESKDKRYGVANQNSIARYEVSRKRTFRKHFKPGEFLDYLIIDYASYCMGGIFIVGILFPGLMLPLAILFFISLLMSLKVNKYTDWALNPTIYLINKKSKNNAFVKNELKHDQSKYAGLLNFGNDIDSNGKAIWFNREQLVTHIALFGTTGSGKTEYLLGLMYQLILMGSGFLFVDGKASIKNFCKVFSMARQAGLEDNILVVNFYTGGDNNEKKENEKNKKNKISNTLNPFAYGSSDTLMEILSSLMSKDSGNDSMWRDRAEALGRCLLRALCELRDKGNFELSIATIREHMPLEKLSGFLQNPSLSKETKESIQFYLNDLPGWSIYVNATEPAQAQKAELEVNKQHNFLTMQFTHVLELLAGTYAHITHTDLSEVDFMDVIVNRRILYVMLPDLEKSPESLKNLGRLVVSSIRIALSRLLGIQTLTGSKEELIDNKAFNANVPYGMFFDEYGTYCVDGFAGIAAQARDLNVMLVFAGQDYVSFKQGSENEAKRIISNTGISIFLKTECLETKQLAIDRAGSTFAYLSEDIKRKPESELEGYRDTGSGKLKEVNRILFDDLFSHKPGQCHIIYGDYLWKAKSFYGDFQYVENYRLNSFIKLKPTSETGESHADQNETVV